MLGMGTIIHHCTDRTMKIKFIGNIGHWWLAPCHTEEEHESIHSAGHDRKPIEKIRFSKVCDEYRKIYGCEPPLPDGVFSAIMEFTR